jgi:protein-L-isoaspartate O-methyltransferase
MLVISLILVASQCSHGVCSVDYDSDYVASCDAGIKAAKLEGVVSVQNASIYDYKGGPYDAVYFSGSLMLMPDTTAALKHVATLLAPGGKM